MNSCRIGARRRARLIGNLIARPALHLIVLCLSAALVFATAAQAEPEHDFRWARDSAAGLARDGRHEEALAQLHTLRALYPDRDAELRADLVAVLEWAGRAEEALAMAAPLQPQLLEDYALLAWARALRSTGASAEALRLLQPQLARPGGDVDIAILHALLLTDLGRDHEARSHIIALTQRHPFEVEVHAAAAFIHRRAGHPVDALAASERTLQLQRDHHEARRQRVFALTELGAISRARELAMQSPTLFSAAEHDRLAGDVASQNMRWTRAHPDDQRARFALADAAIAELETLLASPLDETRARSGLDLVVALRRRERMQAAVAQYQQLLASGLDPPPYVRHAAADAHLAIRRPQRAVELYDEVLIAQPMDIDARLGRIYALLEAERMSEAQQAADALVADLPAWQEAATGQHVAYWPRLNAELTAAMLQAYANRPAHAQRRLQALVVDAPASAQIRRERSTVYRWRGWPHRAALESELALAYEPDVMAGRLEQVEVLLALERHAQAEHIILALQAEHPQQVRVQRLSERWQDRSRWSLRMEAGYGDGDGFGDAGARDRTVRTRLSAPWVHHHWQPYVFQHWSDARFPAGVAAWRRIGAGLDWRDRRRHAYAAVDRNASGAAETGLTLGYDWHRGDHWSFATRLETFSLEAPLRARDQGIEAWKLEAAARWQAHESLSVRASAARLDLSDGNTRVSALLAAQHRVRARAHHVTSGTAELYSSRASQAGGAYFNPARDAAFAYTLTHDWLTWRDYERAFTQRFIVGAGGYWQQDFGTGATMQLRYEHAWRLSRTWRVGYGIGVARRPFDGEHESRVDGSLMLQGLF